jgi:hypothetical protein
MRIIQRGEDPKDRLYRWTCMDCKSIIESTGSEGQFKRDNRDGLCYIFICPVCARANWISISSQQKQ